MKTIQSASLFDSNEIEVRTSIGEEIRLIGYVKQVDTDTFEARTVNNEVYHLAKHENAVTWLINKLQAKQRKPNIKQQTIF